MQDAQQIELEQPLVLDKDHIDDYNEANQPESVVEAQWAEKALSGDIKVICLQIRGSNPENFPYGDYEVYDEWLRSAHWANYRKMQSVEYLRHWLREKNQIVDSTAAFDKITTAVYKQLADIYFVPGTPLTAESSLEDIAKRKRHLEDRIGRYRKAMSALTALSKEVGCTGEEFHKATLALVQLRGEIVSEMVRMDELITPGAERRKIKFLLDTIARTRGLDVPLEDALTPFEKERIKGITETQGL